VKIALLGYGKMGKAIEQIALERGHDICLKVGREGFAPADLGKCDVAIEFSIPATVVGNIQNCFAANVPVVVGTTAWYDDFEKIKAQCINEGKSLLTATNFSIGVNMFFELNKYLANLMNLHPSYDVHMEEIHHLQKLDAPSGTGITLAEGIISELDRKNKWIGQEGDNEVGGTSLDLKIISKREPNVPGTHSIHYKSDVDSIEIKHTAHNRTGFALGSVIAAEWLVGKQGVFGMNDVLSLNK
jgi:4-hydroxy-tetrahydrodipicolinate reductase